MKFHVVLSHGDSPERPARLTLAEGPEIDRLRHVSSTDDPQEFYAILQVLNHGGLAPHPRIEREWGAELRRLYKVAAAARGLAMAERQPGRLGQRLHGVELPPPTGAEGAGPDKPA
jgi:hypothetical protein